jgi:hypothetical protein
MSHVKKILKEKIQKIIKFSEEEKNIDQILDEKNEFYTIEFSGTFMQEINSIVFLPEYFFSRLRDIGKEEKNNQFVNQQENETSSNNNEISALNKIYICYLLCVQYLQFPKLTYEKGKNISPRNQELKNEKEKLKANRNAMTRKVISDKLMLALEFNKELLDSIKKKRKEHVNLYKNKFKKIPYKKEENIKKFIEESKSELESLSENKKQTRIEQLQARNNLEKLFGYERYITQNKFINSLSNSKPEHVKGEFLENKKKEIQYEKIKKETNETSKKYIKNINQEINLRAKNKYKAENKKSKNYGKETKLLLESLLSNNNLQKKEEKPEESIINKFISEIKNNGTLLLKEKLTKLRNKSTEIFRNKKLNFIRAEKNINLQKLGNAIKELQKKPDVSSSSSKEKTKNSTRKNEESKKLEIRKKRFNQIEDLRLRLKTQKTNEDSIELDKLEKLHIEDLEGNRVTAINNLQSRLANAKNMTESLKILTEIQKLGELRFITTKQKNEEKNELNKKIKEKEENDFIKNTESLVEKLNKWVTNITIFKKEYMSSIEQNIKITKRFLLKYKSILSDINNYLHNISSLEVRVEEIEKEIKRYNCTNLKSKKDSLSKKKSEIIEIKDKIDRYIQNHESNIKEINKKKK